MGARMGEMVSIPRGQFERLVARVETALAAARSRARPAAGEVLPSVDVGRRDHRQPLSRRTARARAR